MARTARLALEIDGRLAKRGASEAERELSKLKGTATATNRELRGLSGGAEGAGRAATRGAQGIRRMRDETDRAGSSFLRAKVGAGGLASSLILLRNAAVVVVGIQLARAFLDITDKAKKMDATLRLAIPGTVSLAQAQANVARIANTTRSALEPTAELYGKVSRQAAEMGKSHDSAARATETFAKTLKISGAAQSEVDSVTRQFGQALASGVLRGDEFNSVMENSPRLARLLADSLGKPVGELRKMAEEGKLTSDILYNALTDRRFTDRIDAEFNQLPKTFAEAMTMVKNSAMITFSEFDQGGGFSNMIVDFFIGGADGMKDMAANAEEMGMSIRGTLEGLADAWQPFRDAAKSIFAAMGMDFDQSFGEQVRAVIRELLGSIDLATEGIARVRNFGNRIDNFVRAPGIALGLQERSNTNLVGTDFGARFERGAQASDRRTALDKRERDMYKNMPTGLDFRAPGSARRFLEEGVQRKAPPRTAPTETAKGRGGISANAEVGREWNATQVAALLRSGGFGVNSVNRSAADQQRQIDKWKAQEAARPGSGGVRPAAVGSSAHERNMGVDIDKRHSMKSIKDFLKSKGVPIGQLLDEGDHKHLGIGGKGGGGKSEADKAADLAARKVEQEKEFFASLKQSADVAHMQTLEAERYNAQASLRKIINEGNLGTEIQLTAEQERQIDQEQARARMGDFRKSVADDELASAVALRAAQAEAAVLAGSTAETEEQNLAVMTAGLKVKEDAIARSIPLTDATVVAAVKEAEARARTLSIQEQINRKLREGRALAQELIDRADPAAAITRDAKRQSDLLSGAGLSPGDERKAREQLNKETAEKLRNVRQAFFDKVLSDIEQVGAAIGGSLGAAVQSAMTIGAIFAQMSQPGYQAGEVGAQANNPVSKLASGLKGLTESLSAGLGLSGKQGKLAADIGGQLGKFSDGAAMGTQVAGIAKAIGIKKFSTTGSQIGGGVGGMLGAASGIPGGQIIGQIAGSVLGGVIGGLFAKKLPNGSSTVTSAYGNPTFTGDSKVAKESNAAARSIQEGLIAISDQFNAQIGTFAVSIGKRDGDYRVDTSGRGNTTIGGGAVDFNDDLEGAVKFAIVDAIKDGALKGLSATVEKMFKSATPESLDRVMRDALKLNSVQRELKAIRNPTGLAIEDLNKGFSDIKQILDAYGGTLQEYADAEELYQIRRKELIENGNNGAIKAMRDYLFQLRGGTSSPLSPELRYLAAQGELNRLDATRASGGNVDFGQYQSVSDAFLTASRESQGSGMAFFQDLRRVTETVSSWIDREVAANTLAPSIDFTPVVAATDNNTTVIAGHLGTIIGLLGGGSVPGAPTVTAPRPVTVPTVFVPVGINAPSGAYNGDIVAPRYISALDR